jgi:BirA family biotin operon repressor/biotin-[acetyl-CoA-carboxylase] ligase
MALAERGQRSLVAVFRSSHENGVAEPFVVERPIGPKGTLAWTRLAGGGLHGRSSLEPMGDSLRPEAVEPRLRGRFGRPYLYFPVCASTQYAFEADAPEGAVAATDHQTEGRGRLGRRWEDVPGTSLLCSLVLRPAVRPDRLPELTVLAAEACAEAIADVTGLRPALKLPNDVLLADRKVAGILGEAQEGRVVLGIGVNANQEPGELPADVRLPATSLRVESGMPVDRAGLLAVLLERLEASYDRWLEA